MSYSKKFQLASAFVMAVILSVGSIQLASADPATHDATYKALGQHQHYNRSYRSFNYSTPAPVQQRSYSVAPQATRQVPPAPAAAQEHHPSAAAQAAPAPAAVQTRRSYSYDPQPVYRSRDYGSYRSSTPAYALPRAMRH